MFCLALIDAKDENLAALARMPAQDVSCSCDVCILTPLQACVTRRKQSKPSRHVSVCSDGLFVRTFCSILDVLQRIDDSFSPHPLNIF